MNKMFIRRLCGIGVVLGTIFYFYITSSHHSLLSVILQYRNSTEKDITAILGPLETTTTWESGWKLWNEEQERRKQLVRNVCQGGNPQFKSQRETYQHFVKHKQLQFFLVSDKYKAIYCYIPKNSCTNWKRMWMVLTGRVNTSNIYDIGYQWVHKKDGMLKEVTKSNTDEELVVKFENYTKVIVVRHPIERLMSAYFDKIYVKKGERSHGFQKAVLPFVKKLRKNVTKNDIQWFEFMNFVSSPTGRNNNHWKPFDSICYPCDVEYDVIVKFETMAEDEERFLRLIKAPENLHFPPKVRKVTPHFLTPYLKNLTAVQKAGIAKYFGKDFEMFGYDKSSLYT